MSTPPPPPGGGWNPPPPPGGPSWPPPGGPTGPGTPPPFPPPGGSGTPPPFPPPGGPGTPPPFGLPGPPPPPRRSSSGALIALIVGGGLVAVLLIAAAFFVLLGGDDRSPEERLQAAARKMNTARAVELDGTFGFERLQGKVKVTGAGRVTGDVTWSGDQVSLLVIDQNVFVKADPAYWRRELPSVENFPITGEKWGKVGPAELSFDFKRYATPSALASRLRAVTRFGIRSDLETTLEGRDVVKITTTTGTYYLSEDDELLRIESTAPALNADVVQQSSATAAVSEMRSRVGELRDSVDTTRTARVSDVEGCKDRSVSGCTVRVQVMTAGAAGGTTEVKVYVWITAETKTGRKLGDCTTTATTTGITPVWTECRVSSPEWRSYYGNTSVDRHWWMQADVLAVGASSAEIQTLQTALARE
ncbi:hypothetical protein [Thermomonospora cellulosilytica]|uniref:Uncharacterized protein n=1 Tax=Thermomonospora cellulosilytica TaxID=1411118 RepID=A0A7W3MT36_9ACTN|nr:hypothetical protein [Thermomonospora cellulosilytica]MBA9001376.1 hypothetical protein [Thermomonospora cellulosilytica]